MTVLENMSMRPRTEVRWETGGIGGVLVRFELDAKARRALRERAHRGRSAAALQAALDASWQALGLRGAVLVYQDMPVLPRQLELKAPRASGVLSRIAATDRALVTNVLGRARTGLLLPELPLELEDGFLSRTLWSDDPRLVAAVQRTGVEEIP